MVDVTNITQTSFFSLVKTQLKTSSVLNQKFKEGNYHRFEPTLKNLTTRLPVIVIKTEGTDGEFLVLSHGTTNKRFTIQILLLIDFSARDKFDTYADAILSTLEAAETTFEASGYYDLMIKLIDSGEDIIQDRRVVSGTFELTVNGMVQR